jgi:hypothetical protein
MDPSNISENNLLDHLVNEPRETLDIEVKEWLDLSDNDHRAALAKEIIALANNGGGYVVAGFKELNDGSFTTALPPPASLDTWSQDAIQAVVAKYIDPGFQCRVSHRVSTASSGGKHPIIAVPGGHRVPVRAKAGSPDGKRLVPHRVYIRRHGPNSEEPKSADEWDRLFDRCLQNRKAELLDAMRAIMEGIVPIATPTIPLTTTFLDKFTAFQDQASARWAKRVESLPRDVTPRFPFGYYDAAFAIEGNFERKSLTELSEIIGTVVRNHSGWPPFLTIRRTPHTPRPVDGAVECWIGPEPDGSCDIPAHHDFWRISPEGFLFTRRGYQEDGLFQDMEPGKFFDITSPTLRLGEAVLEASYIANALSATEANLLCHFKWTGLSGRGLTSRGNPNRRLYSHYAAAQDTYQADGTIALSALPDALPELVFRILAPLYELFDFFKFPKRLVEEELATMSRNQFAS